MSSQVSVFWWRWLLLVTIGVFLFGLGFIFLPDVMQGLFNWMFYGVPEARFDAEATHYIKFTYGVLGAVMAGWMAALLSILLRSFRRGEREAWDTIALSMVVWFIIDTPFSLSMGFPQNAIFNVLFLVLFAVPLGATYQQFHPK